MIWSAISGAARLFLEFERSQPYVGSVLREVKEMILAYVKPIIVNASIPRN
jgi:hypothetical protein